MSTTITVDIDSRMVMASLDALPFTVGAEIEKAMILSSKLVEAEVKALTPRRSGRLFSAWHSHTTGIGTDVVGHITNNVGYAGFVEEGTARHEIVARGRALMIPVGGDFTFSPFGGATLRGRPRVRQQVAFFKKVQHPGTLGAHMARFGLGIARPGIFRIFRDACKDAVRIAFARV